MGIVQLLHVDRWHTLGVGRIETFSHLASIIGPVTIGVDQGRVRSMLVHLVSITESISIGVCSQRVTPVFNLCAIIEPISIAVRRGGVSTGLELTRVGQPVLVGIAFAQNPEVAGRVEKFPAIQDAVSIIVEAFRRVVHIRIEGKARVEIDHPRGEGGSRQRGIRPCA